MKAYRIESNFYINHLVVLSFSEGLTFDEANAIECHCIFAQVGEDGIYEVRTYGRHDRFSCRFDFFRAGFLLFGIVYLNSTGFNAFIFICRDWSLYVEAWNDLQSGESHPSIDEGHDPTGAVIDVWPWWRGLMGVEMDLEIECAGFKIRKRY